MEVLLRRPEQAVGFARQGEPPLHAGERLLQRFGKIDPDECAYGLVQSDGERRIAEWLVSHGIVYRYDARLRIIEGFQIRPDFYLPEYDVFIEYWGMDTPRYKAGMYLKQDLYMHSGKRLISLYPEDKTRLDDTLGAKLAQFGRREVHRT